MTTAVATTTPAPGDARPPAPSGLQVHKPGEGYATRLGIMVVVMAYTGFACHHWYYHWVYLRDFADSMLGAVGLGFLTRWTLDSTVAKWISTGGTVVLAATGFAVGYYFVYIKRNTAEFLIKTDTELGKVTWPKIVPWFKADTQVWGATYVVLIVVVAMTLYVFGVDFVLQSIAQKLFYNSSR